MSKEQERHTPYTEGERHRRLDELVERFKDNEDYVAVMRAHWDDDKFCQAAHEEFADIFKMF